MLLHAGRHIQLSPAKPWGTSFLHDQRCFLCAVFADQVFETRRFVSPNIVVGSVTKVVFWDRALHPLVENTSVASLFQEAVCLNGTCIASTNECTKYELITNNCLGHGK